MLHGLRELAIAIVLLAMTPLFACGQGQAGLSGTVRDLQGLPQVGALVELLSSTTSLSAFTDLQGHFQFRDVAPGMYQLRASAVLFLPALRKQLHLQAHDMFVVNVTLSGLFEESAWISTRADRRRQQDDWSWTLRSPANRPMLRMIGDPDVDVPREARGKANHTHVMAAVSSSQGVFGASGLVTGVQVEHAPASKRTIIKARVELVQTSPSSSVPPVLLSTSIGSDGSSPNKGIISARVQTFPQVYSAHGRGLRVIEVSSAQHIEVGEMASVEVGGRTQLITADRTAVINRPFLHIRTRPFAGWRADYALATSPDFARFDDAVQDAVGPPAVLASRTKLLTEAGLHQQISTQRVLGHAAISLAYHHDTTRRIVLPGELTALPHDSNAAVRQLNTPFLNSVAYDTTNGVIRVFTPGHSLDGFNVGVDLVLGHGFSTSGTYLKGGAARLLPATGEKSEVGLSARQTQAFVAVFQGKFQRSRTKVSASYRWQPSRTMSVIAPYTMPGTGPYLGIHLRQALPLKRLSAHCVELTVDGDNLLGEGYQASALAGQSIVLASALREMRSGVSFSY